MTGTARRVALRMLCDRLDQGEALTLDALAECFGPEVWVLVGAWAEGVVNAKGFSESPEEAAAGGSGDGRAGVEGS